MRWRLRFASVRVRITVLATVIVAVALVIGSFALLGMLRGALLRAQSGSAPYRAAELSALAEHGPLPIPLPPLDTSRLTLLQVLDGNGRVVAASRQLQGVPALQRPGERSREVLHRVDGLTGGPWLAERTSATIGGQPTTVVVLTSLDDYARSADLVHTTLLIVIPALVGLVGALVWIVVGRALRPVELMRTEVANITGRKLDRRVPTPPNRDEVARLGHTLNDMLDRLQVSSEAQRRFVADASHELRTPIANIRAALEVATAHPELADWPTIAQDVLHQDARMEHLTADLLLLARADAGALTLRLRPVELSGLVTDELSRAVPDHLSLIAAAPLPEVTIAADGDQLGRVLTNLVDNALRHANHTVAVGLTVDEHWVEISVSDDGPGIAPQDRLAIFDPFVRLDDHRARSQGGAGLGLTIAHQLVQAHNGSLSVAEGGTGATFVVRLPRSPSGSS